MGERWVLYSGSMIIYEGKPAILGTLLDITDIKKTEESLSKKEAWLQAVIAASKDAMIAIRWDINGNGVYGDEGDHYHVMYPSSEYLSKLTDAEGKEIVPLEKQAEALAKAAEQEGEEIVDGYKAFEQRIQREIERLEAEIAKRNNKYAADSRAIEEKIAKVKLLLENVKARIAEAKDRLKKLNKFRRQLERGTNDYLDAQAKVEKARLDYLHHIKEKVALDQIKLIDYVREQLRKKPMREDWFGILLGIGPNGWNVALDGDNAVYYWYMLIQAGIGVAKGGGTMGIAVGADALIQIAKYPHYKETLKQM